MKRLGRNINVPDVSVTTVTINPLTATTILAANPFRIYAYVSFTAYTGVDWQFYVREYAAAIDNLKKGYLMSRIASGNSSINNLIYRTVVDNPYQGELSAISQAGTFDIHITEATY